MKTVPVLIAILLVTVSLAKAQSPSARKIVSVCDVQQKANVYDGQEIEIKARVIMGFESFTVFSEVPHAFCPKVVRDKAALLLEQIHPVHNPIGGVCARNRTADGNK